MFDNAVNGPSKLQFCGAAGLFFLGFWVCLFFLKLQQMNIPAFSFLTQRAWEKVFNCNDFFEINEMLSFFF